MVGAVTKDIEKLLTQDGPSSAIRVSLFLVPGPIAPAPWRRVNVERGG